MRTSMRRTGAAAIAVAGVVALAACSGGGGGEGGGGEAGPIKVGQITTQSGGFPFGDVVKGTQSYINMLNENGGIDGHQVEFLSGDDKGDNGEAAQLARKMVQQDGVIGMVGNTSLVDCAVNRDFYEANNIGVVGGAPQAECFTQPNWAPVNAGPYVGHEVMWTYVFDELKPEYPCMIEQNDPVSQKVYEELLAEFEERNGVTVPYTTWTNDASQNPTPAVTDAKSAGCDLIMMSTVAPNFAAFIQSAASVGLDATFIVIGSGYDVTLPETLGELGNPGALGPKSKGVFVAAELAPLDSENENVQQMNEQFEKDGTPGNFWSEIGWLSAKVFFEGLEQGAGEHDIATPEGALEALRAMEPIDTGFAATPLTFGDGETHAPNLGSKMLTIQDGQFVPAAGEDPEGWITVDPIDLPTTN